MPLHTKPTLPHEIQVVITYEDGYYVAELPSYDVVTQATTMQDLVFLVNDLICALFDIPTSKQTNIWYKPSSVTAEPAPGTTAEPTHDTYKLLGTPTMRADFTLIA